MLENLRIEALKNKNSKAHQINTNLILLQDQEKGPIKNHKRDTNKVQIEKRVDMKNKKASEPLSPSQLTQDRKTRKKSSLDLNFFKTTQVLLLSISKTHQ